LGQRFTRNYPYCHAGGRLKNTHLDVSPKSRELVQHPSETQSYDWFLGMGTAYLVEANVSGPVLVLVRCKNICYALRKIQREAHKEAHQELYGIKVESCKPL
jgi:hypothetical protein